MRNLLGAGRLLLLVLIVLVGMVCMILASLFPARVQGATLPAWIVTWMARVYHKLFNVRFRCTAPERFAAHRGFIAANHSSFLDVIALLSVRPVRFLSAVEVAHRPGLGWLAKSIDTVFVDRSDPHSRRSAAAGVIRAYQEHADPPIVIFPEGRLGPGDRLHPFKLGLFKMAAQHNIAYMPCAIRYSRLDIAVWQGWRGEGLLTALWRAACFFGPLRIDVIPLEPVQPMPQDRALALADAAQSAIGAALDIETLPALADAAEDKSSAQTTADTTE